MYKKNQIIYYNLMLKYTNLALKYKLFLFNTNIYGYFRV
jgi:hypothetical protein